MMQALCFNTPCIVDRILDPSELPAQAGSQKEVLEGVIAECEKAIASNALPKRNGPTDKNGTAIMTKGFAQFIAGKAAMFNNDPATARKYLGDLISSGDYKLVDSKDYWKLLLGTHLVSLTAFLLQTNFQCRLQTRKRFSTG